MSYGSYGEDSYGVPVYAGDSQSTPVTITSSAMLVFEVGTSAVRGTLPFRLLASYVPTILKRGNSV